MGSGIAAHLCNADIPVVLLDLKTEIAEKAKERIIKSRPPLLFEKKKIKSLTVGNIAEDFDNVSDAKILGHPEIMSKGKISQALNFTQNWFSQPFFS